MAIPTDHSFRHLLLAHVARYPLQEPQDVYKLLFQGCCGPEHAVERGGAQARLAEEVATLREAELEPMIELLPPGGAFVRVHLRPFVAAGGQPVDLAAAFVRSAQPVAGGRRVLGELWTQVEALAEAGLLPFGGERAREYGVVQASAGYPPCRHSPKFNAAYWPAYRVIAASEVEALVRRG